MDNAMSLKEMFFLILGISYVVNHHTKEVHNLNMKHKNCKLQYATKRNSEHITKRRAEKLISKYNYNGCRWCFKEQDKG